MQDQRSPPPGLSLLSCPPLSHVRLRPSTRFRTPEPQPVELVAASTSKSVLPHSKWPCLNRSGVASNCSLRRCEFVPLRSVPITLQGFSNTSHVDRIDNLSQQPG